MKLLKILENKQGHFVIHRGIIAAAFFGSAKCKKKVLSGGCPHKYN
jgi:hypothetical protein